MIFLIVGDQLVGNLSKLKATIIQIIEDNKDKVISQITAQKEAMFENNTHSWSPLKPQTIERKKREKDLFKNPESINIRKGGLFQAFTNTGSYKVENNNEILDFNIDLSNFEKTKSDTVASHGRNAVDITASELNQITNTLAKLITENLKQQYE